MTDGALDVTNWVLAVLTMLVWGSTYALFALRDPKSRHRLALLVWRARNRLHGRRRGPRPVPARLLRPPAPIAVRAPTLRPPGTITTSRTATARAIAVAEPVRIAEWRVDNLPMRYRLLGRVRRGANDN